MFILASSLGCVFSCCIINVILSCNQIKVILSCKALYVGSTQSVKSQAVVCDLKSHSELISGILFQLPITGRRYLGWHMDVVVFTLMFLSVPKAGINMCVCVICHQLLSDEMFYFAAKNL